MVQEASRNLPPSVGARWKARLPLALFYAVAGVLHVTMPSPFIGITPHWVPSPHFTIILTGLCECAGAIGILVPRLRRAAGIGLALYAVCVFPANVNHMLQNMHGIGHPILGWWYHWPRLALQPVIVWWALYAGGSISWPLGQKRS